MKQTLNFQNTRSFEERKNESDNCKQLYPNDVLVVVEQSSKSKLPKQNFIKFKMPNTMTIMNVLQYIKSKIKLSQYDSINLYCGKTLLRIDQTLKELYQSFRDQDGFLYINYIEMNSFGTQF
ncbi:unnamed protein product (macronuclear) [Paramecium tetraurelia]|uniref:Autophagy-related protein n=1 Tax=Paramecium tetraurelia TaxID=5888 RepID=A0DQ82_PARTE|nr:uncharacterized protein GSPATT00002599001 [Paramecium tetraurelia]CAK85199.1 unnamed protein product [Paramecium tetraurelia]|eukprot:XP_001452596.1 hypothetical protein (macronuclear) [Paramecium tetraurelia strain d4-2]